MDYDMIAKLSRIAGSLRDVLRDIDDIVDAASKQLRVGDPGKDAASCVTTLYQGVLESAREMGLNVSALEQEGEFFKRVHDHVLSGYVSESDMRSIIDGLDLALAADASIERRLESRLAGLGWIMQRMNAVEQVNILADINTQVFSKQWG